MTMRLRDDRVQAEAASMAGIGDIDTISRLAVALGIGLLVGIERERRKGEGERRRSAGLRTFALIALSGALAAMLGAVALAVAGGFTALAALASWRRRQSADPGLTTEFAMLVVFLLGMLAMRAPAIAAAAGVTTAVLLASKTHLHRFVRDALTEQELDDALLLATAAAIVLPLLPDRTIDPWDVLNPRTLWLLAIVMMAINAAGHVAVRVLGTRSGLLVAGLAGGFASSTATTAAMGTLARREPAIALPAACAALASNISTVVQLAVVVGLVAPALLARIAWPLAAAGAAILAFSTVAVWRGRVQAPADPQLIPGRAFGLRQALVFVAVIAGALLASAAAADGFGGAGFGASLALSGFADVHAAAASAGQLQAAGHVGIEAAAAGVALAFATNSASKCAVGFFTGGAAFAARLLPGLVLMTGAFAATLALWPVVS